MKKAISIFISLVVFMSLAVPSMSGFALEGDLYSSDFESETVGSNPASIAGAYTDVTAASNAVVVQGTAGSGNDTKYINVKERVRALFNNPISSGAFIVEFDANPGKGYVALGLVYNSSPATYAKWPVWLDDKGNVMGYTKLNGLPPAIKEEYGTKQFLKASDSSALTFTPNTWQHYKVRVDCDNKAVTAWIDGVESKPVTGYEYFTDAIGGIGFYVNKVGDQACIDNLRVYNAPAAEVTPEEPTSYVDIDFESETKGEAPTSVLGFNTSATADEAVIKQESDNNYLAVKQRVRAILEEVYQAER